MGWFRLPNCNLTLHYTTALRHYGTTALQCNTIHYTLIWILIYALYCGFLMRGMVRVLGRWSLCVCVFLFYFVEFHSLVFVGSRSRSMILNFFLANEKGWMPLTTAHPLASNRSSSEELNRIVEALKQSLVSNDSIRPMKNCSWMSTKEMKWNRIEWQRSTWRETRFYCIVAWRDIMLLVHEVSSSSATTCWLSVISTYYCYY
jgi:hypothetical protein